MSVEAAGSLSEVAGKPPFKFDYDGQSGVSVKDHFMDDVGFGHLVLLVYAVV